VRLKELSDRLTSETGRSIAPLAADLNDKADLAKVERRLEDDQTITMLVNNAGVGSVAPLLKADIEMMADMIALNVTALTRLTYAAVPAFVARGAGTIINIASVVGISPETSATVCTERPKPMSLRSATHCSTSSPTKASASWRCCRPRPRPTSGSFPYQNLPQSIVISPEDMVDFSAGWVGPGRTGYDSQPLR